MSGERFTLDTNILVYSVDARDARKHSLAIGILKVAVRLDCALALQAVGEFFVAASSKVKISPKDTRVRALQLMQSFETFAGSATAVQAALAESAAGRFSYWDALLLASAAEAGCSVIFSEDMGDSARLGSITVCNPFGARGRLSATAQQILA